MKNPILRILISAILLSLLSSIVVLIIGFVLRWKTSTQFSNGFFWAGAIIFAIGFVNAIGRLNQPIMPYSSLNLTPDERFKLWMAETFHGYNILAFLWTSGALLFGMAGLAILVGRLF